jgi:hypothetical protein
MAGFVKTGTVKGITLTYDDKLKYHSRISDVLLVVKYTTEQGLKNGIEEETLNIFGNFNKDKGNWGGALKIKMFFEAVGIKNPEYSADYSLPEEWLDKAMGQDFLVLSYPSKNLKDDGKPWWNTFMEVMHPMRGMDKLKERFQRQINEGWVKDYKEQDPLNETSSTSSTPPKDEQVKPTPELDLAGLGL